MLSDDPVSGSAARVDGDVVVDTVLAVGNWLDIEAGSIVVLAAAADDTEKKPIEVVNVPD